MKSKQNEHKDHFTTWFNKVGRSMGWRVGVPVVYPDVVTENSGMSTLCPKSNYLLQLTVS